MIGHENLNTYLTFSESNIIFRYHLLGNDAV
jgi:hypothetical protein